MRQLLLDLGTQQPQTLESFVIGQNEELIHSLRQFASRTSTEHFGYLWGEPASGKTHLLRALADLPASHYLSSRSTLTDFAYTSETALYLLDDCHQLSADAQIAAFTLFNQIRDHGGFMVSSGDAPPASLAVRDDLRSRMGWGLIYQVHRLSDEEKITALTQSAQARGLALSPSVLPYLITHYHRDMRSLATMLDALDRYSLETQRAITLPLLRELLQQEVS